MLAAALTQQLLHKDKVNHTNEPFQPDSVAVYTGTYLFVQPTYDKNETPTKHARNEQVHLQNIFET